MNKVTKSLKTKQQKDLLVLLAFAALDLQDDDRRISLKVAHSPLQILALIFWCTTVFTILISLDTFLLQLLEEKEE